VCVCVCSFHSSWGSAFTALRDEFAEVKAVKLLRRGRRLQQAEYASCYRSVRRFKLTDDTGQSRIWQGPPGSGLFALGYTSPKRNSSSRA
jgi:hypothetical protein